MDARILSVLTIATLLFFATPATAEELALPEIPRDGVGDPEGPPCIDVQSSPPSITIREEC